MTVRPRWHDVAIVLAIVALAAVGVWALWWDDVRTWLGPGGGSASAVVRPQT